MSETMTAAVLYGPRDLRVHDYPRPELHAGMVLLRVRRAGLCGSDLHYVQHGSCAGFVPTRPFVLGHEVSAEIAAAAPDVDGLPVGTRVAVNPARACDRCPYCRAGRRNLCGGTLMLGSASTQPPTDGAWAQWVAVSADQCHVLPDDLDDGAGAMIEPFAVALHAVRRAGPLAAARVLVAGGGTIGLLTAFTARALGAALVVSSDVVASRRTTALELGVDDVLDPADRELQSRVREWTGDGFDLVFEAAGAAHALRQAFEVVRPGGTIVQVGTLGTGDVPLPANDLMRREIQFVGSFRYAGLFDEAIRLARAGRVPLGALISRVFPLAAAAQAVSHASQAGATLKIQLRISEEA